MPETKEPTQQEMTALIEKGLGTLLTADEIVQKKKDGQIPEDFDVPKGFGVYRVEINNEGYLCITKLLCEKCERKNGEVKKCPEHAPKLTTKVVLKPKVVQKNADEKKAIPGAVTPYAVLSPGIGGAIILVRVKADGNKYAGPLARNMHCEKGILVRGPDNIPQFIPKSKIVKGQKHSFEKYTEGELIMLIDKALFVPKTAEEKQVKHKPSVEPPPQPVVEHDVGTKDLVVCVQMEVAENGLPVMKIVKDKPKDKEIPIGVIVKVNDEVQFVQVGGKEVGGGAEAPLVSTTPRDDIKKGELIAVIRMSADGKPIATKPEDVPKDAKVIGTVVAGNNKEPVYVAKGEKVDDAIEKQNRTVTKDVQKVLEKAQVEAIAKTTGQTAAAVAEQVSQVGTKKKEAVEGKAEQPEKKEEIKPVGASGAGAVSSSKPVSSNQPAGIQRGSDGEVKSSYFR